MNKYSCKSIRKILDIAHLQSTDKCQMMSGRNINEKDPSNITEW